MAISGTFAQGDEVSFNDCLVSVDIAGGTSYAEIATWATNATLTIGEVPVGETYPFAGSVVLTIGNKPMDRVHIECLYTQDSTDPFENIYDLWQSTPGALFSVKLTPAGSAAGQILTAAGGYLVHVGFPAMQGDGVSPAVFTFDVVHPGVALTQA